MKSTEKDSHTIESLESAASSELGVFKDPAVAEYWRLKYESCNYEGAPFFDPEMVWTKNEEKKLVRALDLKVFLWVFFSFCSLDLVRRNVTRAVADNFLDDLGMTTDDYNLGQAMNLVAFLCAELPGNLLSKRFGCEIIIPAQMVLWSILCICQTAIKNKGAFIAFRVLIGVSQGGFIPDNILYLSYYYTSTELPIRLAIFWTAIPLFQILGSLLASGIIEMRGIHGLAGWRYLFLIEGFITLAIGIASWYFYRAGPTQTENKIFKTKPWFNEREVKILVNRVLRDDPSKGDMNNRQGVDFVSLFRTLKDYDLWPLFIQGIMAFIPFQPVTNYMSLILKQMGYSTFMSNILVIPGQFWFLVNLPLVVLFSHYIKEKSICIGLSNIFIFPFILALVVLPVTTSHWVKYVLLIGILAQPYTHAILAANVSQYSNTVRARAVGTSLYNMCYQVGSIIATQLYKSSDSPNYTKGNATILGICCFNIAFAFFSKFYYIQRNQQKEKKWQQLSKNEQEEYLRTTKDQGMKRLDFRFVH
ncbi:hypothetical protein PSN45_003986 [Yamadazyma tenuis]|uniref:MFS general substrate transporter n=1 Tax=Candida tenuis (strain ATCC 10573 / BCRC 21748 / CBS 615 / JCM 9827 / NBRC 10315 / NRRL Y-1498 / VKM Y-70) TaxID=590646 RepID=G3B4B2_CANTC|nr:MFS general substrate transporter [Yamadazyma tenuis ATCC 10573]XP_006686759.1 uncharacterized protein CANTEDRAFT_134516 [Yamadazyma tenuis ATCC 10573]EGV64444.1 MFS general substrate transporter [Yamadazyma tenuis ATCC 10573]EGV64445.1 hypothetical protein CANTEDRAFT_134516 [Yamadazyma tenuis ATCC 10573]WEJ96447.1 hypothetical protein PSN45_003986 [Yamadazyma tenuis]